MAEMLVAGRIVLVDDEDMARIASRKWGPSPAGRQLYICATTRPRVALHRFILNAPKGMRVDHINGDTFDNRRANLRLADAAQNAWNAGSRKGRFKGISAHSGGFRAEVRCRRTKHYAGWAKTEEAAARLYDAKARELHGEFARLNFPD